MNKAAEVIIHCLKERGMSQTELASIMDEDVRLLNQQLNRRDDIKVKRFVELLGHLGYVVDIVDNSAGEVVTRCFVDGDEIV